MFKDEFKQIKETKKDLSKFGYTMGIIAILIAVYFYFKNKTGSLYPLFLTIGSLLIIIAYVAPVILKIFNKLWMMLAIVLGFIMTRVILCIFFYVIITPYGLIMKMFGKDSLNIKFKKDEKTYWVKRDKTTYSKIDFERQF